MALRKFDELEKGENGNRFLIGHKIGRMVKWSIGQIGHWSKNIRRRNWLTETENSSTFL